MCSLDDESKCVLEKIFCFFDGLCVFLKDQYISTSVDGSFDEYFSVLSRDRARKSG